MLYSHIVQGTFLSRPNRFIAEVEIRGKIETVHVKNTGRCRELLLPGTTVYLEESFQPLRRTKFDLVVVEKRRAGRPSLLINMDSQAPNTAAAEWLKKSGLFFPSAVIRREVRFGNSRFDFFIEDGRRRVFLEVKGVTLEEDGVALFPDAPSERGVKHLHDLICCREAGCEAMLLFVIQMKEIHLFRPNDATHPAFGDALRAAEKAGVNILAMDCRIVPDEICIDSPVTFFSKEKKVTKEKAGCWGWHRVSSTRISCQSSRVVY